MTDLAANLWAAVDRLTKDTSEKVTFDDGTVSYSSVPSLWVLAENAIGLSAQGDGGGKAKFERSISDLNLMEVRKTIIELVADKLTAHGVKPKDWRPSMPGRIRQLAALMLTDEHLGQFAHDVNSWANQIANYLQLERTIPDRYLRNTACELCKTQQVTIVRNGERVVVPAMKVEFMDDYWVRSVFCQACGHFVWRGDLEDYAARIDAGDSERICS